MRQLYYDIKNAREDITDYVYHFTQGLNAFETLQTILREGCLRDIHERKENDYRICFTEAPLKMQPKMFKVLDKEEKPRFAPYGIGIKKDLLFDRGARPVIYGDYNDYNLLPKDLKWRFVSYRPGIYDYSWQREWRLPQKEFPITPQNCVVIVKLKEECQITFEPSDIIMDGDIEDGNYHCLPMLMVERAYRSISLEEVEELNSGKEVDFKILKQDIGDKDYVSLGHL